MQQATIIGIVREVTYRIFFVETNDGAPLVELRVHMRDLHGVTPNSTGEVCFCQPPEGKVRYPEAGDKIAYIPNNGGNWVRKWGYLNPPEPLDPVDLSNQVPGHRNRNKQI